jgi:ferredoxin
MPLDKPALKAAFGAVEFADQLCRAELSRFNKNSDMVTCTQETALFQEINPSVTSINIREMGLWSDEAGNATAKTIALIKAAKVVMPPVKLTTLESKGVTLIYGVDETAFEIANALKDTLDVTVLLKGARDITPPSSMVYPIVKGVITAAKGVLGASEFTIDDYALPLPSSRQKLLFAHAHNGASSSCDIFIDVTGETSFFPAHELREGYLKVSPNDAAGKLSLIHAASNLVGVFDKPRFIDYKAELCAHSRNKITGCTKCLDVCPTGAITPQGDKVLIDAHICAGCGACAASCPTGAATYALPSTDSLLKKIRVLLQSYQEAGGKMPLVLLHDEVGIAQLEALARYSKGLPAHVLPVRVNEIYSLPLELFTSCFSLGAKHVAILSRAKPKHDLAPLLANIALTNEITTGLGYGSSLVSLLESDDYEAIYPTLKAISAFSMQQTPSAVCLPALTPLAGLAIAHLKRPLVAAI